MLGLINVVNDNDLNKNQEHISLSVLYKTLGVDRHDLF